MKNTLLKKMILSGILSACALISFLIENLLPPLFIPGARIGISNVFILLSLLILGNKWAFAVLIIKVTLGSVFSGNISAVLYSLPAGIASLTVEIVLLRFYKKFSILSVSLSGAVINSSVQNTVFCMITKSPGYLLYLPYLTVIAVFAGLVIGIITHLIIKYLPQSMLNIYIEK